MNYKYNPIEDCYATKKKIKIFRKEIEYQLKKEKNLSVLDFGCGNANDCGKFLFNENYKYTGFDIHKPSITYAKKVFNLKNVFFETNLNKQKYDVILISEVLEHLNTPDKTLKLLFNMLKPKGIILGSIPNGYGLTEIEKFIIHKFGIYKTLRFLYNLFKKKKKKSVNIPFNYESGHLQFFTLRRFKSIINDSKLKIEFIKNGTLMGADLSGSTFLRPEFMKKLNTKIAEYIPSQLSATWIFKLSK
tara:strand:+ start:2078 stop:2815 length:738 start_codon:yes stop_codon:yes gene_type:complete